MSISFNLAGLIAGFFGAVFFFTGSGIAAVQGGILLLIGAVLIAAAAILDKIDQLRRDVGLASAEAVKTLLAGVRDQ
jgi:cytochrome c biogenesis protein CcdA